MGGNLRIIPTEVTDVTGQRVTEVRTYSFVYAGRHSVCLRSMGVFVTDFTRQKALGSAFSHPALGVSLLTNNAFQFNAYRRQRHTRSGVPTAVPL